MPRGSPFTLLLLLVLFAGLVLVAPLLFLGVIGGAFSRLGFSTLQVVLLLALTLVGSFVNIPIARVRSELPYGEVVRLPRGFMIERLYRIPSFVTETVVAVNLGGAVVPTLVSLVLVLAAVQAGGTGILAPIALGVLGVTLVTRLVARPVPGLGITTPFFVPPLGAAIAGILLAGGIPGAGPVIAIRERHPRHPDRRRPPALARVPAPRGPRGLDRRRRDLRRHLPGGRDRGPPRLTAPSFITDRRPMVVRCPRPVRTASPARSRSATRPRSTRSPCSPGRAGSTASRRT